MRNILNGYTVDMKLIILAIIIFTVISLVKTPKFKGMIGEFLLNVILKLKLDSSKYILLKNITLPTKDGSTQIDHIVLSPFGIFVIETKNYRGWIFGSEHQKYWTQTIYRSKNKFQNPLHQNYKHIKTLEECLGVDKDSLFSVIVFTGHSQIKTKLPDCVTSILGCADYVKSKKTVYFSKKDILRFKDIIENERFAKSVVTNIKHTAHVKSIVKSKGDIKLCPKCGSKMILRKSKKGKNAGKEFYGCENYPKCRMIIPK